MENKEPIGEMLGGMIESNNSIADNLLEAAWREAEKWAQRYRDLYLEVEVRNDSVRVGRLLNDSHSPERAERAIEHYQAMRGEQ